MKRLIAVFLMLLTVVSLCACGSDSNDTSADSKAESKENVSVETTEAESEAESAEQSEAESSESVGDGYTVTVVDSDNNPVANAIVQMCKLGDDGSCTPGTPTDAEGKTTFNLPDDSYKVSFIVMPAGYTYIGEEQEFYFEAGSSELIITLAKAE